MAAGWAYPFVVLLGSAEPTLILVAFTVALAIGILALVTMGAYLPEPFGAQVRYTGAAVSFNLAGLIGGGGLSPRCVQLAAASPYAARHRFGRSLSVHSGPQKTKAQPKPEPAEIRDSRRTCALVDVWVSRDVEPPVGLAVRLRALGAEVRVCAPPDCAEQLADMQSC